MKKEKNLSVTSQRIRALRIKADLTQEEMGKKIGVSKSSISEYETGDTKISVAVLKKYAEVFHKDIEWLTGIDQKDPLQSVSLFTSDEINLIIQYRHKSRREQDIMRLQAMSDAEYDQVYNHDLSALQPQTMLNEQKNNDYHGKGKKK